MVRGFKGGLKFKPGGVEFAGNDKPKISKEQETILKLLTKDFLTIKQIAQRRKTSVQAVYKILKKLKEKGLISRGFKMGGLKWGVTQTTTNKLRLHNEQFKIRVIYKSNKFLDSIGKQYKLDENTVIVNNDSIDVYSNKSFYGKDMAEVQRKASAYWERLFFRIENDLSVLIMKDRAQNIKRVRQHISETNNELAKDCNTKKEKIIVKDPRDNKIAALIDNSFNLNEFEATHPKTAPEDIVKFQTFFNDLRKSELTTLSDLKNIILDLAKENQETVKGLNSAVYFLKEVVAGTANNTKILTALLQPYKQDTEVKDSKEKLDPAGYIG